jgi:hypothetical protein
MFGYLKEKAIFFYKAAYIVSNFYLGKSFYKQPQIKSSFVPISTTKNDSIIPHVYMCCK